MNIDAYELLKTQVWGLLKNNSNIMNEIMHLDGVAILCGFIGAKRKLNIGICRSAGLLHDLWLYLMPVDVEIKKQHGYMGSELARNILIKNGGYLEDEIDVICRMIYNHNDKDIIHDGYSEALKDADSLQHYLNDSNYDRGYNHNGRDKKVFEEFMISV